MSLKNYSCLYSLQPLQAAMKSVSFSPLIQGKMIDPTDGGAIQPMVGILMNGPLNSCTDPFWYKCMNVSYKHKNSTKNRSVEYQEVESGGRVSLTISSPFVAIHVNSIVPQWLGLLAIAECRSLYSLHNDSFIHLSPISKTKSYSSFLAIKKLILS